MLAFGSLFVSATIFIAGVHASPAVYPEVIPGPGLPSLESLGLTSKDLYTTKPQLTSSSSSSLEARSASYTDNCFTFTTANVDNTIACYNYLVNIGNNACTVPGDNIVFCRAGDAAIGGSNLHQTAGAASSACWDVSIAVQWIFNHCNVGGRVGGAAAANGNGDLVVGVYNTNWV
ncbi:hypothetical protein CPB83DRAFT_898897 [Crepidotus variabilis]|uniref:Uncharacterized protein n=1 Tax=Crepidotus variabilis TaxID=179855 RepID=A0A9P6E6D6_9AGAR|nr:hypothetical protein CPB83DRAFT_898897 [Crepidotus variabilis]